MARPSLQLLAIVPAWNEEKSIAEVLDGLQACAGRLAGQGIGLSVCVIDDGSTDGTAEAARRAGADCILTHRSNRGVGAAVRSGLARARDGGFDLAVKLDADGQHDPADIPALIAPILEDRADLVFGNRFPPHDLPYAAGAPLGKCGFPLPDAMAVVRLADPGFAGRHVRREPRLSRQVLSARRLQLHPAGIARCLAQGNAVCPDADRLPRAHEKAGVSFISFKYPFKVLPQILLLLVMVRPLKVFLPLAGLFLAVACWVVRRRTGSVAAGLDIETGRACQPGAGAGAVRHQYRLFRAARRVARALSS